MQFLEIEIRKIKTGTHLKIIKIRLTHRMYSI